jgi:hypothetical protein
MVPHEDTGRGELEKAQRRGDFSLGLEFEQNLIEGHVLRCAEASGV